jgi:hypothetical protein
MQAERLTFRQIGLNPNHGSISALSLNMKASISTSMATPPRQCDLIVCWPHYWKNCPQDLQVLELSKLVGQLAAR